MRIVTLTEETKQNLLEDLLKRSPQSYGEYEDRVAAIVEDVRRRRDEAVFEYTEKFDHITLTSESIRVTKEEIEEAYAKTDVKLIEVIKKALTNIRAYHEKQRQYSWFDSRTDGVLLGQKVTPLSCVGVYVPGGKAVYPSSVLMNVLPAKVASRTDGVLLGQKVTPLSCVGVYVPGGKAVYPSSVLMNVLPAKVAGVEKIIMTTPCGKDGNVNPSTLVAANEAGVDEIYKVGGAQAIAAMAFGTQSVPKVDKIVGPGNIYVSTLVAANEAGVDEIYKVGGAQAIAAMAFGTQSVPKVDKIVGPGNIYVALAKKAVYGFVNIDSIAGPSEILVLADATANPRFVAADLLSQAEHDELASAILITTSRELAEAVSEEVTKFTQKLSRKEIIEKSLDNFGYILVADSMDTAITAANDIASEHLEIVTANPFEVMTKIKNAGAIFIGEYSSEPLGDYFAGPNHVLPTNGTARFFSPLGVDDFIKKSSIVYYSKEALSEIHEDIEAFAKAEQLTAHANSIHVRFE